MNPAGTAGMTPAGRATPRPKFGAAGAGRGSAEARGCGNDVVCCAIGALTAASTMTPPARTDCQERREVFAAEFIDSSLLFRLRDEALVVRLFRRAIPRQDFASGELQEGEGGDVR